MTLDPPIIDLPDDAALAAGLAAAGIQKCKPNASLDVLDRQLNEWLSTYPSEVITCRDGNGGMLRILCKYSGGRRGVSDHRAGVAYEAQVYRHVLDPPKLSTPRYLGTYRDPSHGWTWLFLEAMEEAYPIDFEHDRVAEAAAWLGRFHAAAQRRLDRHPLPFLRCYDMAYHRHWARRAADYARPLAKTYPWVTDLCRRVREPFELLLTRPQTVIHGEFTVHNVLVDGDRIRPVDWESAAIGAGEIDLATLIEGWPDDLTGPCIHAYCAARWPDGDGPPGIERALDAANVHLLLRGLGGDPAYTTTERTQWRFEELMLAGQRWGLL